MNLIVKMLFDSKNTFYYSLPCEEIILSIPTLFIAGWLFGSTGLELCSQVQCFARAVHPPPPGRAVAAGCGLQRAPCQRAAKARPGPPAARCLPAPPLLPTPPCARMARVRGTRTHSPTGGHEPSGASHRARGAASHLLLWAACAPIASCLGCFTCYGSAGAGRMARRQNWLAGVW